jgi:hypothetical protein
MELRALRQAVNTSLAVLAAALAAVSMGAQGPLLPRTTMPRAARCGITSLPLARRVVIGAGVDTGVLSVNKKVWAKIQRDMARSQQYTNRCLGIASPAATSGGGAPASRGRGRGRDERGGRRGGASGRAGASTHAAYAQPDMYAYGGGGGYGGGGYGGGYGGAPAGHHAAAAMGGGWGGYVSGPPAAYVGAYNTAGGRGGHGFAGIATARGRGRRGH